MKSRSGTAARVAGGLLCLCLPAAGALYWNSGVRVKSSNVCFVGDALTSRPARVQQIMTYLKEYEGAANIKFNFAGTCPAPTKQPNGDDFFAGDIRVVIPGISASGTGMPPGQGCTEFLEGGKYNGGNEGWGSWSNSPDEAKRTTQCLYNLKLGDDGWNGIPYLNHTLHEFGHALGLAHEHLRTDVDRSICTAPDFGGGVSSGFITPYDRYSVMHYKFAACGINGNYDYTGLSVWDRLAVHILYPEDALVAEFVGTTVVRTTDAVQLQSSWKARGANMTFVATNFQWKIGGNVQSTTPDLNKTLPAGNYSFEFAHSDFLGRNYTYRGTLTVLAPASYDQQVAQFVAAGSSLL